MFRLTASEFKILKSQIVTSSSWGGKRKLPLVFTEHGAVMAANLLRPQRRGVWRQPFEHGAVMAANLLRSQRAIRMSIEVVRAFIQLRQFSLSHVELARKIETLERKYDGQFEVVFDAIRALMDPPEDDPPKKPVGFNTELES